VPIQFYHNPTTLSRGLDPIPPRSKHYCSSLSGIKEATLEKNDDAKVMDYGDLRLIDYMEIRRPPMPGYVVHYSHYQILRTVVESRNPKASLAKICIDNDVTPRILRSWQQMYASCATEDLKDLVGYITPQEEVIITSSSRY